MEPGAFATQFIGNAHRKLLRPTKACSTLPNSCGAPQGLTTGPIRHSEGSSLSAPPSIWVCWAGQVMKQQLGEQLLCGEMFQATVDGTQGRQCRGSSHCANAAFTESEPRPCCWGRMGDGNPTSGERVQIAWKHPSDCHKKVFFPPPGRYLTILVC